MCFTHYNGLIEDAAIQGYFMATPYAETCTSQRLLAYTPSFFCEIQIKPVFEPSI